MANLGGSKAIELVTTGQYDAIASCIDNLELQVTYRAELDQRPELATLQLLGHIYNGDLEDARFVYKRSSNGQKQDPQFQAAFAILQHLWNKEYETVWSTFAAVDWAEPMPQLIKAIADKQQQHVLQLVSWAYSNIQPEKLASLTGTSSADVLQLAEQEGWQLDQAKNVIWVKRKQQQKTSASSMDHLQHLTEFKCVPAALIDDVDAISHMSTVPKSAAAERVRMYMRICMPLAVSWQDRKLSWHRQGK